MQERTKLAISERALYQRINRRLSQAGERLCTARGESAKQELGDYYVVETGQRTTCAGVAHAYVDLETLGRELGAIRPWEEVMNGR